MWAWPDEDSTTDDVNTAAADAAAEQLEASGAAVDGVTVRWARWYSIAGETETYLSVFAGMCCVSWLTHTYQGCVLALGIARAGHCADVSARDFAVRWIHRFQLLRAQCTPADVVVAEACLLSTCVAAALIAVRGLWCVCVCV